MQNYYNFANDTKNYLPAFAAVLTCLVIASGSKHILGEKIGRTLQFFTLVGFMLLSLGFGKQLFQFISTNLIDIPSANNSSIHPNLAFSCLVCFLSFLLVFYGAYLLIT